MSKRFATLQRAADLTGRHYGTIRNRIKSGDIAAYKLPNRRGYYVDLDEAQEVLTRRARYGSFGPDAKVRDLSNVVNHDFDVDEGE